MLYNQTFELVETTKLLERVPVDTMTFQNTLGHDYLSEAIPVTATFSSSEVVAYPEKIETANYKNIVPNGTFTVYGYNIYYQVLAVTNYLPTTVTVNVNGEQVFSATVDESQGQGYQIGTVNVLPTQNIEVIYTTTQFPTPSSGSGKATVTATYSGIYVLTNIEPTTPYTIATVIQRILNAGLGNNNGAYTLDPNLYDFLNAIPAPEFCITRKNLYEALLEVAGYGRVQGIPTLIQDSNGDFTVVSFTLLSNNTPWNPTYTDINKYIAYQDEQDAESYCGGIEIYVDNLVDNSTGGSVEQPFAKTVRTESADLVINDNAAIIPTEFPIWSVQSVTQAYVAAGVYVGDISPYIFEKSQYDNLTSYIGDFPYAKQYAFYYVQGQPNLYGLTLKPETATDIDAATQDFAAVAIAARKGKNYDSSNGISAFAYQVNYTPITTRRLRQYKANMTDGFPTSNVLFYNPSTNIADSRNLGEHAAAQLQKIGNLLEIRTYRIDRLADLPEKGMTVGDSIITQVDLEFELLSIKATIYLTKYNRLSEYIGINSTKRFYEVSEKQSVQRALNYSFVAGVGTAGAYTSADLGFTETTVQTFAETFNPNQIVAFLSKVQCVVATTYDADGNPIESPTLHTVSSNGFGKSSAFFFSFEDNYSAGNQAVYCSYTPSGKGAQKLQRAVRYSDETGRFYSLKMEYYTRIQVAAADDITYNDQLSTSSAQGFCDALPVIDPTIFSNLTPPNNTPIFTLNKVVDKNGGEQISVDFQIHFAANAEGYIVGNALGARNTLVVGYTNTENIYTPTYVCLPYTLAYNQETIPVSDIETYKVTAPTITPFYDTIGNTTKAYVQIGQVTNTTGTAAQSWAVVHQDGAILLGQNVAIAAGATGGGAYINLNAQAV